MARQGKVLTILFLVLVALVAYLVLSSESIKKTDNQAAPTRNENVVLSEQDYQAKVKEIFSAYQKLAADNKFTKEKVAELKNELLKIKGLQEKFQKLHLDFVLALDKTEDYINQHDQSLGETSQLIIDQLKAGYSWLNN
ncbi:MAG: hypothetical protein PHS62_03085 [Patescibacteria group bacterium]|nr:hypothetical protein [Patescibacteria group bacterium]